jgi:hypothetical protein
MLLGMQSRFITADYAHCSFTARGYIHSLDILSILCLTATKFESFVRSVSNFALASDANIGIFMIKYFCCLLPA